MTTSVNPLLRTILFTPSVTTGQERGYNASGRLDLSAQVSENLLKDNVQSGYTPDGWGVPICLMGAPGIGKTTEAKAVCAALGLSCVTSIASTKEPTDYNGIPMTSKEKIHDPNGKIKCYKGGETVYATGFEPVLDNKGETVLENGRPLFRKPGEIFVARRGEPKYDLNGNVKRKKQVVWVADTAVPRLYVELAKQKNAVLFLDELTTAAPAVQAALLRLCLDKKIGEFSLPPGIRIIAAANATQDAANGSDIALPLANRFVWNNWDTPTVDSWATWLISGGQNKQNNVLNAEAEQARVLSLWGEQSAKVKGVVCGYLKNHSAMLFKMPHEHNESKDLAFPTPRSWHMAINLLTSARIQGLSVSDQETLISGVIGRAAASELFNYLRTEDLPNPVDILNGKITFKHNMVRPDITFATLTSLVALLTNPLKETNNPLLDAQQKQKLNIFWELALELLEIVPDMILNPVSIVLSKSQFFLAQEGASSAAMKIITRTQSIVAQSGFVRQQ